MRAIKWQFSLKPLALLLVLFQFGLTPSSEAAKHKNKTKANGWTVDAVNCAQPTNDPIQINSGITDILNNCKDDPRAEKDKKRALKREKVGRAIRGTIKGEQAYVPENGDVDYYTDNRFTTTSNEKKAFQKLMRDPSSQSGEFIIQEIRKLQPQLGELLDSTNKTKLNDTIQSHTATVIDTFNSQYEAHFKNTDTFELYDEKVKKEKLMSLLRSAIALHDIGKPLADLEGDTTLQHDMTDPILRHSLRQLGYSTTEIDFAATFIGRDPLGDLSLKLRDLDKENRRGHISPDELRERQRELRKKTIRKIGDEVKLQSSNPEHYVRLKAALFSSDATYYHDVINNFSIAKGGIRVPNAGTTQQVLMNFGISVRDEDDHHSYKAFEREQKDKACLESRKIKGPTSPYQTVEAVRAAIMGRLATFTKKDIIVWRWGEEQYEKQMYGRYPAFDPDTMNYGRQTAGNGLYAAFDPVDSAEYADTLFQNKKNPTLVQVTIPKGTPEIDILSDSAKDHFEEMGFKGDPLDIIVNCDPPAIVRYKRGRPWIVLKTPTNVIVEPFDGKGLSTDDLLYYEKELKDRAKKAKGSLETYEFFRDKVDQVFKKREREVEDEKKQKKRERKQKQKELEEEKRLKNQLAQEKKEKEKTEQKKSRDQQASDQKLMDKALEQMLKTKEQNKKDKKKHKHQGRHKR